jgi:hypothetical protein
MKNKKRREQNHLTGSISIPHPIEIHPATKQASIELYLIIDMPMKWKAFFQVLGDTHNSSPFHPSDFSSGNKNRGDTGGRSIPFQRRRHPRPHTAIAPPPLCLQLQATDAASNIPVGMKFNAEQPRCSKT